MGGQQGHAGHEVRGAEDADAHQTGAALLVGAGHGRNGRDADAGASRRRRRAAVASRPAHGTAAGRQEAQTGQHVGRQRTYQKKHHRQSISKCQPIMDVRMGSEYVGEKKSIHDR